MLENTRCHPVNQMLSSDKQSLSQSRQVWLQDRLPFLGRLVLRVVGGNGRRVYIRGDKNFFLFGGKKRNLGGKKK